MTRKIVPALLLLILIILNLSAKSQSKKTWTAPVEVTEMNGGKIYVSFCNNSRDSLHYRITSKCKGLKNIYTCFTFKYFDSQQIERRHIVRDIPLSGSFHKQYGAAAENGFSRISVPFLPETVVAYVRDDTSEIDIREH